MDTIDCLYVYMVWLHFFLAIAIEQKYDKYLISSFVICNIVYLIIASLV